jgi:hypothetical protein
MVITPGVSKAKVIKAWPRKSSHGTSTYEIILRDDGHMSCNCPGWVIARKGLRSCKHTKELAAEAAQFLDDFRAGRVQAQTPGSPLIPAALGPGPAPARRIVRID